MIRGRQTAQRVNSYHFSILSGLLHKKTKSSLGCRFWVNRKSTSSVQWVVGYCNSFTLVYILVLQHCMWVWEVKLMHYLWLNLLRVFLSDDKRHLRHDKSTKFTSIWGRKNPREQSFLLYLQVHARVLPTRHRKPGFSRLYSAVENKLIINGGILITVWTGHFFLHDKACTHM